MATEACEAALRWKDKGNALFAQRKFAEAANCYTEALAALNRNDLPNDAYLLAAVSSSNHSSCFYETGDYGKNGCAILGRM